jgi:hypothetical protein
MQPIWINAAVLAVAGIYYLYRAYLYAQRGRQRRLAERVAYMLWVTADSHEDVEAGAAP